jgi:gluconolactonase
MTNRRNTLALLALTLATPALADPTVIDPAAAFPEGPWVEDGTLYYVQYAGNVVSVWDGTALSTLWTGEGCGPSAIAPLGNDFVLTCYDNGTIARIGRDGSDIATYSADSTGAALQGPNDFTPDGKGGVWFTASGPWESGPIVGKVYHLTPDGTVTMLADDLHYANGIALAPAGDRLYVNESEAGRVISFAVAPDGSLSDRRLFARIYQADAASGAGAYPDGLKWGPDGNLWVGQYSMGRIVVLAPDGSFVKAYDLPSPATPNFAFSGDGTHLYVMAVDDTANAPYTGKVYDLPLD